MIAAMLPALISTPVAGAWADQFDRRWIVAATDVALAAMIVVLALLLLGHALHVYHLYAFNGISAVLTALRMPSYQALLCGLLPKDQLTRANGLLSLLRGSVQLAAPLLAGILMAQAGLSGIMWLELPLLACGMLAEFYALAQTQRAARVISAGRTWLSGLTSGFSQALSFLQRVPQLIGLLIYMVIQDGLLILVSTMLTPLILSTHSSRELGFVNFCAAAGGLAGSLSLALANTQKSLMTWVLVLDTCLSFGVFVAGLYTSTMVWCACAFGAMFAGSASGALMIAFWMRKTPDAYRGSLFALIGACHLAVASLVMLIGGFIGERVFEPALSVGGRWAPTLGHWIGTGKGRGLGLLFVICGVLCTGVSLVGLAYFSLSKLDELVGDEPGVA
jgi:diaminobutyrate-2-oxoglutarate transaminase